MRNYHCGGYSLVIRPNTALALLSGRGLSCRALLVYPLFLPLLISFGVQSARAQTAASGVEGYVTPYNHGLADYKAGRLAVAEQEARVAAAQAPDKAEVHELLGMILLGRKAAQPALSELKKAVHLAPNDLVNRKNLAQAYLEVGRYADAEVSYRRVLTRSPQDIDALGGLAAALAMDGDNAAAVTAFQALIAVQPTSAAYVDLALVEQKLGRLDEAANAFRQAAGLDPTNSDLWLNTGLLNAQIGENGRAAGALGRSISLGTPKKFEAHFALAQVYSALHKNDLALAQYEIASRLRPTDANSLFNIAVLNEQAGDKSDAVAAYKKLLATKPSDPDIVSQAQNNLGLLLAADGDSEDAIPLLTAAIAANPKSSDAHAALGDMYSSGGNTDQAISEWKTAVSLNPSDEHSLLALADAYLARRQYKAAIAQYDLAKQQDPNNASVEDGRGEAFEALKSYKLAMAAFTAALKIDPNDARAENNIGATLQDEGKTTMAIAAYRKALAIDPGLAEAKKNLANLTGK